MGLNAFEMSVWILLIFVAVMGSFLILAYIKSGIKWIKEWMMR